MRGIEERTIAYDVLRYYTRIFHSVANKHISVNGLENVPKNEPAIFAANHQNALLDPFAVVVPTRFQVVYLARADIFKNKLLAKFLKISKIAPVYRIRDGKDSLEKNSEVFENSVKILRNNRILGLYPEASHVGMKSMVQHKKAVSRIVFKAAEMSNFEMDIKIVPIGINYSHYYHFRRSLTVNFGKPLSTKDYYEQLKTEGENKTAISLRDDLFEAIEEQCVHVPNKKIYELYEQSFEMMRYEALGKLGLKKSDKYFYEAEKFLTDKIRNQIEQDDTKTEELASAAKEYKTLKDRLNISEFSLMKGKMGLGEKLKVALITLLTLPLWFYGAATNGWLFYITRYVYRKNIKDRQFWSTFSIGLSWVLFPLWTIIHFFLAKASVGNGWIALAMVILSFPSGILAWEIGQMLQRSKERMNVFEAPKANKRVAKLLDHRLKLKEFYEKAIQ